MEINQLPSHSAVTPLRAPSAVQDGDSGPNSPYYRQQRKKKKGLQKAQTEDRTPRLDGTTSHIDVRV